MEQPLIEIQLLSSSGEGFPKTLHLPADTTVGTVFHEHIGGSPETFACRIKGRECVTLQTELRNGDVLAIYPSKQKAAAPTPPLALFRKYLKQIGYVFARFGKGDHEIWQSPTGRPVILNASKRDKKMTDIASVKQIGRAHV